MDKEERRKLYNIEKIKVKNMWENQIPGLDLLNSEKEAIKIKFQTWATHFQKFILKEGINGLIEKYKKVVNNIKTQTCSHSKNGVLKNWDENTYCCNISYEYYNDISVREALEIIIEIADSKIQEEIIIEICQTDNILKELIIKNKINKSPVFENSWWKNYLPYGIKE